MLNPDIAFEFKEISINKKRIVVLVIPSAKQIPTSFNGNRYFRIGSSKVNLNKYPERETIINNLTSIGLTPEQIANAMGA